MFSRWDDDDASGTSDMIVNSLGAYFVRIAAGQHKGGHYPWYGWKHRVTYYNGQLDDSVIAQLIAP